MRILKLWTTQNTHMWFKALPAMKLQPLKCICWEMKYGVLFSCSSDFLLLFIRGRFFLKSLWTHGSLAVVQFFRSRNPQGVKECCDYLFFSVLRSDVTNHLTNIHIFRLSLASLPADICLFSTSASKFSLLNLWKIDLET